MFSTQLKNYILGSYKLFFSIFVICVLILTFYYKTTERIFTAKVDIREIDWISYNLIFPGFSLDEKYGVVGLYPREINYSFYTAIQSRNISGNNYDVKFNDGSFGNKGGKLYLYYYQNDNDKNIKKNLNDFILNVNQIICKKLFELISYEITKTSKFSNMPDNAPTIEQLTLWRENIANNPKIVSWDIDLIEINTNLPYLKNYLIISFLLSLFVGMIGIILFPKFKKN